MEGHLTPQQLFDKAEEAFDAQNYKDAAALYGQAANRGDLRALNILGYMLEDGMEGVEKDQKRAFYLYSQAASGGLSVAQYNTAHCLEYGIGTTKNITDAIKYYKKAAAQDDPDAKFTLAFLKYLGHDYAGLEDINVQQYFQDAWDDLDKSARKILIHHRGFSATLTKAPVELSSLVFYLTVYKDEPGMFVALITQKPELLRKHPPSGFIELVKHDHERSELEFYSKVLLEEDIDFTRSDDSAHEPALVRLTLACANMHEQKLNDPTHAQSYLGLIKLLEPYFADNCFIFEPAEIFKRLTQIFLQHNDESMHKDCLRLMQSLVDARSDEMGSARTTLEVLQGSSKPKTSAPATSATLCCYYCTPTGTATAQPAPAQDDGYDRKFHFFGPR